LKSLRLFSISTCAYFALRWSVVVARWNSSFLSAMASAIFGSTTLYAALVTMKLTPRSKA